MPTPFSRRPSPYGRVAGRDVTDRCVFLEPRERARGAGHGALSRILHSPDGDGYHAGAIHTKNGMVRPRGERKDRYEDKSNRGGTGRAWAWEASGFCASGKKKIY